MVRVRDVTVLNGNNWPPIYRNTALGRDDGRAGYRWRSTEVEGVAQTRVERANLALGRCATRSTHGKTGTRRGRMPSATIFDW